MNSFQLGCLSLGAPLVGAIFAYIRAYNDSKNAYWIYVATIAISFFACCTLLYQINQDGTDYVSLFDWIRAERIKVRWTLLFDSLSTLMMSLVTFISLLVHIYSLGYMKEDPGKSRFLGHLNLFTFMMLLLVCSSNLLQLFCGWEGVGLASYLLIGYWHEKKTALSASIKAFVVNRVGDIGIVLAIGAIFALFNTLEFKEIFAIINKQEIHLNTFWLNTTCLLLFLGAMGKSGQFGLHIWLPDAMEAPTPVSALLHAATMVTAGVFLVIRFSPLFELAPIAKQAMMFVGLVTGIFAGSVAICQTDIKKIIAYSTCSQIGMMFMSCAAGAYSVAFFHLFTHAFFKAQLFLGAGAVIHAMSHEQNIMQMGGLKPHLPFSYYTMMIGSLALCGFPLFAGYYSKDLIFEAIYQSSISFPYIYYGLCLVLTFLTGIYSWRLLFLVFHGKVNADEHVTAHIHKVPKAMQYPIHILSLGSIISGYLGFKLIIDQSLGFSWNNSIVSFIPEHTPILIELLPLIFACLALYVCYYAYIQKTSVASTISNKYQKIYLFLKNKWYFDELYQKKIVNPCIKLGHILYKSGDRGTIDRLGPDGLAKLTFKSGKYFQKAQTGYLFHYGFTVVLGIVLVLASYLAMQLFPNISKELKLIMGRL